MRTDSDKESRQDWSVRMKSYKLSLVYFLLLTSIWFTFIFFTLFFIFSLHCFLLIPLRLRPIPWQKDWSWATGMEIKMMMTDLFVKRVTQLLSLDQWQEFVVQEVGKLYLTSYCFYWLQVHYFLTGCDFKKHLSRLLESYRSFLLHIHPFVQFTFKELNSRKGRRMREGWTLPSVFHFLASCVCLKSLKKLFYCLLFWCILWRERESFPRILRVSTFDSCVKKHYSWNGLHVVLEWIAIVNYSPSPPPKIFYFPWQEQVCKKLTLSSRSLGSLL